MNNIKYVYCLKCKCKQKAVIKEQQLLKNKCYLLKGICTTCLSKVNTISAIEIY